MPENDTPLLEKETLSHELFPNPPLVIARLFCLTEGRFGLKMRYPCSTSLGGLIALALSRTKV